MNILFMLRLWPVFGGGETMTRLWANEFAKRGANVHVVYFKYTEYGTHPFIDNRIKEHFIEGGLCDEFTSNDADDITDVSRKLCRLINAESIDVVINQWLPKSFVRNIKRDTNAKVVWCFRTMFAQPFEKPRTFKRWLKYTLFPFHYKNRIKQNAVRQVEDVLPFIDKYVFLSEAYRQQYISWSKNPQEEKVLAIPNPVSIEKAICEDEIIAKENIVLVVGRMQEYCKQYSSVIKVWHEIEKSSLPESKKWRLVMVGDGEDLLLYKQMAKDLKLQRVSFEGFQNPLPYYKAAKIFLMTSRIEGFGNVLLEAQKMGVVPIVMDSYPAVRDIINHGYNGILVPKNNIKRMSNAVLSIMADEEYLCKLRKNCLIAVQKYSMDNIMRQWNALLSDLLKN